MMPSSVNVGARPSIPTRRSYSCFVSPCSATSAGVIAGSPARGITDDISCLDPRENRFEETHAIARPDEGGACALGMRHHAEHVASVADYSGDAPLGAVGI